MAVLHRHQPGPDGLRWEDIPVRAYGPENSTAQAASRQILIGTDEAAPHFHLRYFRVEPGGHTSLDQHAHDHGVYVLHGQARVRLGDETTLLHPGDVLYIPGDEVHQFHTAGDEPFGFLCVVPAVR
jgi:quercetin dioxygenase-like cupin family protein